MYVVRYADVSCMYVGRRDTKGGGGKAGLYVHKHLIYKKTNTLMKE